MTIQSIALRAEDDALTLQTIFAFARRRRGVLIGSVVIGLVLAILTCLFATPRYRAVCEVQVQKESGGSFGLENTVTGQVEAANGDSLDYAMTLQTAAAVLRSPALAAAVIESQHLEQTADYFAPSAGAGWAAKWTVRLPWRKPLEPLSVPLSRAPNRRYVAGDTADRCVIHRPRPRARGERGKRDRRHAGGADIPAANGGDAPGLVVAGRPDERAENRRGAGASPRGRSRARDWNVR
jgi:hypothetical protein